MHGVERKGLALLGGGLGGLAALAALAALLAHCSVYDRSLLDPDPNRVEPNSGVGWWSGPGDRGCFSAGAPRPEDRPAPGSAKELPPIYLAIASTRIGSLDPAGNLSSTAWKDLGFDLDGTCTGSDTCEGADSPPSCKPTVPQISTDGNHCRDNTFGRLEYTTALVPELATKYGLSDDTFNCALCVGHYNIIIRISGYNGEANDDRVRVDLYPSPGLVKPLPWDCTDPTWKTRPCFTPDQVFTVRPSAMAAPRPGPDLSDAKAFDDDAFVKDGYLAIALKDIYLWFPGFSAPVTAYPVTLKRGIATGKITRGGDGVWRISDGIIAGRTLAADIIQGFRRVGFCEADSNYALMSDFVAKNLDILADGTRDPERTCDAMSVGIGFTALQAVAGPLAEVDDLVECAPRGKPPGDGGAGDAGDAGDAGGADAGDAGDGG